MYRCRKCGREFGHPDLKQRSYLSIFILTLKAQWDSSIKEDSIYEKRCPFCGAGEHDLVSFIDADEYDQEDTNPQKGEDIEGDEREWNTHSK